MATIITKNSQTASAVPSAASLEVGELAVNTADGKLYTEHTGGVVKEIIPSTVVDGGITTAKIANTAVTEAKIADGAVTTNKLSNSGVTAGTYTTATVTVDAKGRITSASSGSGGGVTSLNGQTGAITNTTFQAIGSYASLANCSTTFGKQGDTIAGSNLYYPNSVTLGGDGNLFSTGGQNTSFGPTTYWQTDGSCTRVLTGSYGFLFPEGATAATGTWRMTAPTLVRTSNYSEGANATYSTGRGAVFVRIA